MGENLKIRPKEPAWRIQCLIKTKILMRDAALERKCQLSWEGGCCVPWRSRELKIEHDLSCFMGKRNVAQGLRGSKPSYRGDDWLCALGKVSGLCKPISVSGKWGQESLPPRRVRRTLGKALGPVSRAQ